VGEQIPLPTRIQGGEKNIKQGIKAQRKDAKKGKNKKGTMYRAPAKAVTS